MYYLNKLIEQETGSNNKEYKENPDNYKGHVGDVSEFLRISLSGKKNSPNLYCVLQILGKEKSISRIKEAINNIQNNIFTINPKVDGDKNIGCDFCKFKDICFMKDKDLIYLDKVTDLSFLDGGDVNV